jgi:IPT/TIG domain
MKSTYRLYTIAAVALFSLAACTKQLGDKEPACSGAPSIQRVRIVAKDSAVTIGQKLNAYSVVGENLRATKQLWINGFEVYVNPALCTENNVIFSVPADAPWRGANKLKIKTNCGEAETNFTLQQPPPVINSFSPVVGNTGDTITITGDLFDNTTVVKFDNANATIVSVTPTIIKVKLPANVATAFIYVTTPGGTIKSASAFGFKYMIYDDVRSSDWWEGSWGGNYDQANTTIVKRGTKSIKATYNSGWAAMQFGANSALNLAGYQGLKLSIYGGAGIGTNTTIKLSVNNGAAGKVLTVTEGQWTDFTIPLSELGNPATLGNIWVQEFNGVNKIIYIDDIGLI